MLARAAASIGLEVNRPPSPEPSRLDDWFLRAGRGTQPRPIPVPFFPEVHEELTKSWMAPFTARSRSSVSSVLTTLDGGAARGYADIPQVERAVAVHLCPRNAATWRNRPRFPSKACKLTAALSAELPEFLQGQDCGSAETVSEAPGAYGIRSCSHAARIASYETTSALVALLSPEMGMAPRYTLGEHHIGVSPLLQPLDGPCFSTGRGALRTSVPACCGHNRCLQHGLGRYMQRAGSLGALDGASTALAHQLPGAVGSASGLAAVLATAVRQACVGPYGQHCGCVVHQPDGRYTSTPHVTAHPPSPPLNSFSSRQPLPGAFL